MRTIQGWVMHEPRYGWSPRICASGSLLWVAWVASDVRGDSVRASWMDDGATWAVPVDVCASRGPITGLAVAPTSNGVRFAWIEADRRCGPRLLSAELSSGVLGPTGVVAGPEVLPAYPAMASSEDGEHFALAWTERSGERRIVRLLRGPDDPGRADRLKVSDGNAAYPAVAFGQSGHAVVWQELGCGLARVVGEFWDGRSNSRVELEAIERSIVARPDVVRDGESYWVAWQTDAVPGGGGGLIRTIDVVQVDANGVYRRLRAPWSGVDRHARGEDQGFEAPCLAALGDGRLAVVGRGSQSLRAQLIDSNG